MNGADRYRVGFFLMLGIGLIFLAACHGGEQEPGAASLGRPVQADSLNAPAARLIESMAEAAASARGQAVGQGGGVLVVQFTTVSNHTSLSERRFGKLREAFFSALTDNGRTYGVIFASAQERRPLASHRLQIAFVELDGSQDRCLVQMMLRGPDHHGRVVRLWEDSAALAIPK